MPRFSSTHSGFFLNRNDDGTTELRIMHNGSEKAAFDATGVSFLGTVAPAGVINITGNISTYQEATLKLVIDTLVAMGLATDNTT